MRTALLLAVSSMALAPLHTADARPQARRPAAQVPAARPPSVKADVDFDLAGFESVFFMKAMPGGKYLTAARGKPATQSPGKTWSGELFFRVTDHVSPVLGQSYGEAAINPVMNDPAKLKPIDATLDAAGGLFVGYVVDTLNGRQDLRIAKYTPVQGQAPVNTAVFDVLCRDQAKGRSIVPDGAGGVFVRGFTWDASHDPQLSVPYTRRFSTTGELLWDQRGATTHQMAVSATDTTPAMVLGVADGQGGLFEVLNTNGVTPQNNFAPLQDRARFIHRAADGSVAYDRAILVPKAGGRAAAGATPGAIVGVFLAADQNPVVIFRKNGDDVHRRLLDIGPDGRARQVASFSDEDFVMQAANGNIVVWSIQGGPTTRYTMAQYGLVGDEIQLVTTNTTPPIPSDDSVWPRDATQVSLSPNGVVTIASYDTVEGRPSIAAMTLEGTYLGSAKSPRGAEMLLNDGKRYFGFVRTDEGGWAYKGGVIDLGRSLVLPAAAAN